MKNEVVSVQINDVIKIPSDGFAIYASNPTPKKYFGDYEVLPKISNKIQIEFNKSVIIATVLEVNYFYSVSGGGTVAIRVDSTVNRDICRKGARITPIAS